MEIQNKNRFFFFLINFNNTHTQEDNNSLINPSPILLLQKISTSKLLQVNQPPTNQEKAKQPRKNFRRQHLNVKTLFVCATPKIATFYSIVSFAKFKELQQIITITVEAARLSSTVNPSHVTDERSSFRTWHLIRDSNKMNGTLLPGL